MPKIVDHDQRRREIAEVVLRIVAADGVPAATLRRVAAGAGVSMGTVQHYFPTTRAMLWFAFEFQNRRRDDRIAAQVRALAATDPRATIAAIFGEVLPIHPATRTEIEAGAAFFLAWYRDPELMAAMTRDIPAARAGFAALVRRGQERGVVRPGVDPDREGDLLWALADALSTGILAGHQPVEDAQATIAYHLDHIFVPSPSGDHPPTDPRPGADH